MKMNLEHQDVLLMFLDRMFCERRVYIGPNTGIDIKLCGPWEFIVVPELTGIIATGKGYPFSHRDIKIEDLFSFISFYDSVDSQGTAFADQRGLMYLPADKKDAIKDAIVLL